MNKKIATDNALIELSQSEMLANSGGLTWTEWGMLILDILSGVYVESRWPRDPRDPGAPLPTPPKDPSEECGY